MPCGMTSNTFVLLLGCFDTRGITCWAGRATVKPVAIGVECRFNKIVTNTYVKFAGER